MMNMTEEDEDCGWIAFCSGKEKVYFWCIFGVLLVYFRCTYVVFSMYLSRTYGAFMMHRYDEYDRAR